MAQYNTGTVNVTNGSATVTGNSTLWLSEIQAGHGFTILNSGVTYTVASVQSNTSLTLSAPYSGTTNTFLTYTIFRDFTFPDNIPEIKKGDIETAAILTRGLRTIQDALVNLANGTYEHGNVFPNIDINGGSIDGTSIGSASPNLGNFTSLSTTSLSTTGNTTFGAGTTITINGVGRTTWPEAGGTASALADVLANGAVDLNHGITVKDVTATNEIDSDNFPLVNINDIGLEPNQVPLNQHLGSMAYQSSSNVAITGGTISGVTFNLDLGEL